MKLPVNKNVDRQRATATRNAAQRKKVIAAMLLLAVMAVLWVRVLIGKGKPTPVAAAVVTSQNNISVPTQSGEVEYIKLPHIPKRHDKISNDSFSAGNFSRFKKQGDTTNDEQFSQADANDERLDSPATSAAAALELVAIVNDKTPQAYIGDMLLEKGQSFNFTYHGEIYRFKILNITADKVELDSNGIIFTKRIPQPFLGTEN
jgi:hypothetical protein